LDPYNVDMPSKQTNPKQNKQTQQTNPKQTKQTNKKQTKQKNSRRISRNGNDTLALTILAWKILRINYLIRIKVSFFFL